MIKAEEEETCLGFLNRNTSNWPPEISHTCHHRVNMDDLVSKKSTSKAPSLIPHIITLIVKRKSESFIVSSI
jgi:hypothetical protein